MKIKSKLGSVIGRDITIKRKPEPRKIKGIKIKPKLV
jgi:hypothetical protein